MMCEGIVAWCAAIRPRYLAAFPEGYAGLKAMLDIGVRV